MKTIELRNGGSAMVDDDDYARLSAFRWSRHPQGYATRTDSSRRPTTVYMHREILGAVKGQIVDHIDRNPANNQRANLRFVSHSENMRNRRASEPLRNRKRVEDAEHLTRVA